jgi:hypothetical protein
MSFGVKTPIRVEPKIMSDETYNNIIISLPIHENQNETSGQNATFYTGHSPYHKPAPASNANPKQSLSYPQGT